MSGGERTRTPYELDDELRGRVVVGPVNSLGVAPIVAWLNESPFVDDLRQGCGGDPGLNAEFIVRACNNHDPLVAALAVLLEHVDYGRYGADAPAVNEAVEAYQVARAALSRARGES